MSVANTTKQSIKKSNPCEAPKSRPLRGAKNREQTSSSASADFLLEAEKRGSPPKSEKAAAFWEHNLNEVGGSGSGVQPFCEKKLANQMLKIAKLSQILQMKQKSQNLIMDCHEVAQSATSRNDGKTENSQNLMRKLPTPFNPPPQGRGNQMQKIIRKGGGNF
ncbi:hypothetical protein [Helicobacter sp. 23-1045]